MENEKPIPKRHQWLFWLILAALSTFFAEVFSGSDMFPYFSAWGLLVVVPLYGLHTILLAHLVYRKDKPRFPSLIFAGMIFGLYEAYLTKVLWAPPWGNPVIIAEVAPVETLVLVTWWHCWFSFIIPLLVAEKLLTNSTSLGECLPGKLGNFLNSWGGLAVVVVFGGVFQSINSPSVGQSLLSGLSTTAVLAGLTMLWKRVTREQPYSMKELLPDQRQFRWLLVPTGIMYLGMGILVRPESNPGLIGHLVIWLLYGISFYLLFRSKKGTAPRVEGRELESWSTKEWLTLAGIFPLAAVAGEILLQGLFEILALVFWLGGILFGIWMVVKAVRITYAENQEELSDPSYLSS